jgi:hypothetical protein
MKIQPVVMMSFALSVLAGAGCVAQPGADDAEQEGLGAAAEAINNCPTVTSTSFAVSCSPLAQDCTSPVYTQTVTTGGPLNVKYDVAPGHCSSLRAKLYVDGNLVYTSGYLGWPGAPTPFSALPLSTGPISLGPVAAGTHTVGITAEGQVSGCNAGFIATWGGTLGTLVESPCGP